MEIAQVMAPIQSHPGLIKRWLPIVGGVAVVAIGCVAWAKIEFGSFRDA